jgi:DNA primase
MVEEVVNPPLRFVLKLDATHPYLATRGLAQETIAHFGLGFCSKGVMAGRIAIPIHDEHGQLVAYAGRWPKDEGWPQGEDKYKLPEGFHKGRVLFNLHRVLGAEHLVVVEGYCSVLRLHALGFPAVALMGRSLSLQQEELLAQLGPDRLTLLLDADGPGRTATAEILPRLARRHFVRTPALPDGASPDAVDEVLLASLFQFSDVLS